MSKTTTPPAAPKARAPSKRSAGAQAAPAATDPALASLPLTDPPPSARRARPVLALLPGVRAARPIGAAFAAQPAPTAEPTPLRSIDLNPEAVSLDAFVARLAAQKPLRPSPEPLARLVQRSPSVPHPQAEPEPAQASTPPAPAPEPSRLPASATAPKPPRPNNAAAAIAPGQTLAERLEMSKMAREAEARSMNELAPARISYPAPAPVPAPAKPPGAVSPPPRARPPIAPLAPLAVARDTLLRVAIAYVDDFQLHIGGPISALWQHRASIAAAMVHVFIPLLMAYAFSHWNPSMQAIFLEGGLLPNLGKMCWLFVVSGFGWTLVYIIGARMLRSLRFDWGRFERIGRGFMAPRRHDE